jgi:hypothetical protein
VGGLITTPSWLEVQRRTPNARSLTLKLAGRKRIIEKGCIDDWTRL